MKLHAHLKQREVISVVMSGSEAPMILAACLSTLCSTSFSSAVQCKPQRQAVGQYNLNGAEK